jgi:hypothetical protein
MFLSTGMAGNGFGEFTIIAMCFIILLLLGALALCVHR